MYRDCNSTSSPRCDYTKASFGSLKREQLNCFIFGSIRASHQSVHSGKGDYRSQHEYSISTVRLLGYVACTVRVSTLDRLKVCTVTFFLIQIVKDFLIQGSHK